MPELHETVMGQKLIQSTLPDIAANLKRIADNMDSIKERTDEVDYKEKYKEVINFIEMTEALTYDKATSKRISDFLIKEGVWKPLPRRDN